MDDRQVKSSQLARNAAARREKILEHQAERNPMLREFRGTDVAHTVLFRTLLEDVNHAAAAGFSFAVSVATHGLGLLPRFVGDLFGETKVERAHRAGLDAEGLFIVADAVAAHGALAGLAGDVVLGDHFPRAGVDAVLAADAGLLVYDHRAFFVFRNCFDGTNGGTGGEVAMHATVARPERRQPFEHRRLHGDPVGGGKFVEAGAVMLVPIFARLHAVAAADAFRRVKQYAPRLAVPEPGRGNEVAISLFQNFNWICGHAASFPKSRLLTANLYHFSFVPVNQIGPFRIVLRILGNKCYCDAHYCFGSGKCHRARNQSL